MTTDVSGNLGLLQSQSLPSANSMSAGTAAKTDRRTDAIQQFDSFFLQMTLEEAMPKHSSSYFGQGFSGDAMRSMLIDRVAAEIAKSGSLGILEAVGGLKGLAPSPAVAGAVDASEQGAQAPEVSGE